MPYANAPYNFVPVAERIVPAEEVNGKYPFEEQNLLHPDRNSGWLDIEMETLTPLYTRGARQPEDDSDNQPADYFHYGDGRPVLPGSSVRGMIRSIFETVTMSRMESINDRQLFYRSFAEAAGNIRKLYQLRFTKERLCAGQLVQDGDQLVLRVSQAAPKGFVLVRADDVSPDLHRRGMHQYPPPQKVEVSTTAQQHGVLGVAVGRLNGNLPGWLIVPGQDVGGGRGRTKRKWFQVILKPSATAHTDQVVPNKVYEDYLAWGAMAHGSRFDRKNRDPRRAPRYLERGVPAFALVDPATGTVEALGANMMMHLRYGSSTGHVYERSLSQDAARVDVDMSQSVFGRMRDGRVNDRTDQIRGRVFFQDAVCNQVPPDVLLYPGSPVKVPDILSGPKPTAFQVYLKQGGRDLVNWDSKEARIAGRKMYWHRSPEAARSALDSGQPEGASDTQTTEIKPLSAGLTFKARIRFENLTDAELGALYASVQLPAGMAHKIGMAKNLGLGSIRVEVRNATLLDMRARFTSPDAEAGLITEDAARERLAGAYWAFVRRVFPNSTTLWTGQRMVALGALLSWDGRPDDKETAQAGLSDQWKYRWVLPSPTQIGRTHGIMDIVPARRAAGEDQTPPEDVGDSADQPAVPVGVGAQPASPRIGDRVAGKLLSTTSGGTGTVLLPDGSQVKDVPSMFGCKVGETYRFKVISVGGDGKVKRLGRA